MRIAICDDERTLTETAAALAERWSRDRGVPCAVRTFSSGRQLLFETAGSYPFDLLLLDIDLGEEGLSGLDVARRVRATDRNTAIAFLTSHPEYVFAGYEVSALHYLMKPVNEEKFNQVLTRAVSRLARNEPFLPLELPGETVRVPLPEIRYLDVQQNYVTVHAGRDYTLKRPLAEFEAALDRRFFRAGRSCIVNLACVRRVTRTEVFLDGGLTMPLSRGLYDAINRAIISRS